MRIQRTVTEWAGGFVVGEAVVHKGRNAHVVGFEVDFIELKLTPEIIERLELGDPPKSWLNLLPKGKISDIIGGGRVMILYDDRSANYIDVPADELNYRFPTRIHPMPDDSDSVVNIGINEKTKTTSLSRGFFIPLF